MGDVVQVVAAADGTYVLTELMRLEGGGMYQGRVLTARNGAEMAEKIRDLFEGPVEDVPLLIRDAFSRDAEFARAAILELLTGRDAEDAEDAEDAVEPPRPLLF